MDTILFPHTSQIKNFVPVFQLISLFMNTHNIVIYRYCNIICYKSTNTIGTSEQLEVYKTKSKQLSKLYNIYPIETY